MHSSISLEVHDEESAPCFVRIVHTINHTFLYCAGGGADKWRQQ